MPKKQQRPPKGRLLEKRALQQPAVREFVFASGNMSGEDMGAALELAVSKMRRLARKAKPPFVAAITRNGEVHPPLAQKLTTLSANSSAIGSGNGDSEQVNSVW